MENGCLKLMTIISLLLGISACSIPSTIVTPQANHTIIALTTANSENQANKQAIVKASNICSTLEQSLKVISLKTAYQGNSQEQQELIGSAKTILPPSKTFGTNIPNNYKYKTTLVFKCE